MKTVVILGAGQMGRAARNLLNPNQMELVAIGDNNPKVWDYQAESQILPVQEALRADPDLVLIGVLIGVLDDERTGQLVTQAKKLGYRGHILRLGDIYETFDLRAATFRRMADRIDECEVPGALAELGAYRGDFAWHSPPGRSTFLTPSTGSMSGISPSSARSIRGALPGVTLQIPKTSMC